MACGSDLLSHLCVGRRGECVGIQCWFCIAMWGRMLVFSIRIVWSAKESQQGPHVTLGNATSQEKIVQAETPHATNCGMLHSYLDHLWFSVQCWHCKTITMGLAMTMALRETDITAKNLLCDAETDCRIPPALSSRNFLIIRNPKHMKWKALGFASAGDLPR